ncbi:TrkH family potassium uptake protein [Haloplasma contractile]|uniref:UDP-N-acetylmuramate dehydrogenase protein n=1 Tax=Haloplasma contractile SSD-17B TaxID=1033810 RepID=U2E6P2_9MOLU|nr:TrkH family potassium uptake protein [Haloplasma contractile]ERJ10893.1 UDP-N-acetylmuramate dehydrogenase protein [Haloplasma contractile SSD-17B]
MGTGVMKRKKMRWQPTQILVVGFASVILAGTILLSLPFASYEGYDIGFWNVLLNAFFTSTSATCVTGLVIVDTSVHWTVFGKTVILLMIQIGGLGIMTSATIFAFALGKKFSIRERLVMQESLNQFNLGGVVRLTQRVLGLTFLIEGIGAFLLMFRFIPKYGVLKGIGYSFFHAISAFCNAGFDLFGKSLVDYSGDPLVNSVILTLIVLGGLGFVVIMEIFKKRKFSKLSLHAKIAVYVTVVLIAVGFIVIFISESFNPNTLANESLGTKIQASLFHAITPRTAGFNTLAMDQLTMTTVFLTIVLMFIGGTSGSTAGGIKTTTFGVLIVLVLSIVKGKDDAEVFKKKIPTNIINKAIAIAALGIGIVVTLALILTITETAMQTGHTFQELFFESVSAFATVGLSLGITADLSWPGQLMIAIAMYFGRVGPLTIFLAFVYKKDKPSGIVKYPEEKVIVG